MIYLLYGTDSVKARSKLHELVAAMQKKKPNASHMRISDEVWDASVLDELVGASGLFSAKAIVEVDNAFRNKEAKENIVSRIKDIAASDNVFIFLEGTLDKKTLGIFEKHAERVQEFGAPVKTKTEEFSVFALADALGRRDKKALWVLYTKALRRNAVPEEIHGLLFWQVKSMMLAGATKSAEEAGLNPFVYKKSQGFLRNYSKEELRAAAYRLVAIYHEARRRGADLESRLEKFILEV